MNKPDEELDALFGSARRDLPPIDTERVATNALRAPVPSAWPSLLPKLALATVILASIGGLAYWQRDAPSAPQVTAPVAAPPVIAVAPPPAPAPLVVPEPTLPPAPAPLPTPRHVARTPAVEVVAPPPPSAAELELQEGAVLLRARRALSRHEPEAALLACDEHAQTFAQGRLAPEREAIAIDALNALGRAEQARARAERFIARWPESAYADRARRALSE